MRSGRRSDSVLPRARRFARFAAAKGAKLRLIARSIVITLISAHRYEAEHRKPIPAAEFPYRDIQFPVDFVYERWPVIAGLGGTILRFQIENKDLNDGAALSVIEALAKPTEHLELGSITSVHLYVLAWLFMGRWLRFCRKSKRSREPGGAFTRKDSEIFQLLVFLLRVGKQETNGRPFRGVSGFSARGFRFLRKLRKIHPASSFRTNIGIIRWPSYRQQLVLSMCVWRNCATRRKGVRHAVPRLRKASVFLFICMGGSRLLNRLRDAGVRPWNRAGRCACGAMDSTPNGTAPRPPPGRTNRTRRDPTEQRNGSWLAAGLGFENQATN